MKPPPRLPVARALRADREGVPVTDVLFVLLTVVVFAVLGVLARGVERL